MQGEELLKFSRGFSLDTIHKWLDRNYEEEEDEEEEEEEEEEGKEIIDMTDFWNHVDEWSKIIDFDSFTIQDLIRVINDYDNTDAGIAIYVTIYKLMNGCDEDYIQSLVEEFEFIVLLLSTSGCAYAKQALIDLCYATRFLIDPEEIGPMISDAMFTVFENAIESQDDTHIGMMLRIFIFECDIVYDRMMTRDDEQEWEVAQNMTEDFHLWIQEIENLYSSDLFKEDVNFRDPINVCEIPFNLLIEEACEKGRMIIGEIEAHFKCEEEEGSE